MTEHSRLKKSRRALEDVTISQWCIVDIDNEFNFKGNLYKISENVEDYKVYNKAGEVEDYTNEAKMEKILAVTNSKGNFKFYNQDFDLIEDVSLVASS